jgi:VanZ family protein
MVFAFSPSDISSDQSGFFANIVIWSLGLFGYVPDAAGIDIINTLVRKLIGHFALFFVDGVFAYLTLDAFIDSLKRHIIVAVASIIMVVLAIGSELAQLVASGRAAMVGDVILDSAGAIIGITIIYWINIWKARKKEQKT